MSTRTFGAHWLAFLGALQPGEGKKLEDAARTASDARCTLFELACKPINGMSAQETAGALRAGGISHAAYCRFFPGGADGAAPFGDPLGDSCEEAMATIEADVRFIEDLRRCGIVVNDVTGPSVFLLGKRYPFGREEMRSRICRFVRSTAPLFTNAGLLQHIEYLRPGEDEDVIGSMTEAIALVDMLALPHVRIHADTFHMSERGEIPHEVLRMAGSRVGYFHAHGTNRLPPGAYGAHAQTTDQVNWYLVARVLEEIGFMGPVVPEPFGSAIREQVPVLGDGLPPAWDARDYYEQAYGHLRHEEVLT